MTDTSKAAAALGRIGGKSKSPRKVAAVKQNLDKANAVMNAEQRRERAKKAAEARWKKGKR